MTVIDDNTVVFFVSCLFLLSLSDSQRAVTMRALVSDNTAYGYSSSSFVAGSTYIWISSPTQCQYMSWLGGD